MSAVELLKKIVFIAIFMGVSWAIFYFAGAFWGFVWLGVWSFLFVVGVILVFIPFKSYNQTPIQSPKNNKRTNDERKHKANKRASPAK